MASRTITASGASAPKNRPDFSQGNGAPPNRGDFCRPAIVPASSRPTILRRKLPSLLLKVSTEVHASVQARNFVRIAVERQRFASGEIADAPLGGLTPARMIHCRIHIGVEAILSWGRQRPG